MVVIQCRDVNFPHVRAILFDKDGTLEDSAAYLRKLGQKRSRLIDAQIPGTQDPLLMAFGINRDYIDPAGLLAVGSRQENEIAAAAYIAETGREWFESLAIARRAFDEADEYLKGTFPPLFIGSLELLQLLSAAGLKLGILSADSTARVQAFVQRHQIGDYVQLQMGVDEGPSKPDPSLFQQACQSLGVEPSATLMVGDSAGDIEMARQARAAGCIGISWKGRAMPGADVTITQLDEIRITA